MAKKKKGDKPRRPGAAKASKGTKGKKAPRQERVQPLLDARYISALANPVRVRILEILAEQKASPKELAKALNRKLPGLSYHVQVLKKCGLIEEVDSAQRRGAKEHYYEGVFSTVLPPEMWDNLPPAVRAGISGKILKEFFDDASASVEAEVFHQSPGLLSLTPLILDLEALEEVAQVNRDVEQRLLEIQADASDRLRKTGQATDQRISATVFLASFLSARSPSEGRTAAARKRR
jgi:DNA-binding transcriptional ArsR family regulator